MRSSAVDRASAESVFGLPQLHTTSTFVGWLAKSPNATPLPLPLPLHRSSSPAVTRCRACWMPATTPPTASSTCCTVRIPGAGGCIRSCQPRLHWLEWQSDAAVMQLAAVQTEQGKPHGTLSWSDRPALPSSLPCAADLPKWIKWFKASAVCSASGNTSWPQPTFP